MVSGRITFTKSGLVLLKPPYESKYGVNLLLRMEVNSLLKQLNTVIGG